MKIFSKKYIQDKVILLLLSINTFLVLLWTIIVSLRLAGSSGTDAFFIEYRPSSSGIAQYQQGGVLDVLSFVVFLWVSLGIIIFLSAKAHHMKRQLALMVLGFGILLSLFTMIVSNALLVLH